MGLGSNSMDMALDRWLTTPPEDKPVYTCIECGADIYEGEKLYRLDGAVYCDECAREWLEQQAFTAETEG